MMSYVTAMSFSRLNVLGLISHAQQDAAAIHPQRSAIGANASPAQCLAWMVEQRIVSHAKLIEMPFPLPDDADEVAWDELEDIFDEALSACWDMSGRLNAQLFDQLVADGFISKRERRRLSSAQYAVVLKTPAQALAHAVVVNAKSQADFDMLLAGVRTEQHSAGESQRRRLVEDAADEIAELRRLYAPMSRVPQPKLHGGLRLLRGGAVLACAFLLYQFVTGVPGCDSPAITKSIQSMLHAAVRGPDPGSRMNFPKLTHITEVGHAWARRQRGCTANVVFNGESLPYTYIVGPLPNKKNKVGFTGANREIVEARFSNIGYDGDFDNKAEPIGRDRLEAAFRAGVASSRDGRPGFLPKNAVDNVMDLFSPVNQDRVREIADMEPLGACRAIQSDIRYACRVMIEHNDPVRAMMGQLPRLLEAEFTFERDAGGEQWRMANDFRYLFDRAVAEGRPDTRATRSAR